MTERVVLEGLTPFVGKHCETSALKRALDYHGLSLSEEMLFGLGGGIGFIYWQMKGMPGPFIGTRCGKVADFSVNICLRIGADAAVFETSSPRRGYEELKVLLYAGEPVVTYVDMAYMPYFPLPEIAHFGGHAVTIFGLDEERDEVHIYDRGRNPVTVGMADLARARGSKFPPFPPKHRLLKIRYPAKVGNLEEGIKESIRECCRNMLEPPIKNIGLAGMQKWSKMILNWPEQHKGMNLFGVLVNGFMYIEIAGTGGSAFRAMYARFLEEAGQITNEPLLKEVAEMIRESAIVWGEIASGYLPDSCPELKKVRELMLEKNRLFEEQEAGALPAMKEINEELVGLIGRAAEDLRKAPEFLADVQQKILRCYKMEKKACQTLGRVF